MKLKHSGMLLLLAALLIFGGVAKFRQHGVVPYPNGYNQPIFAGAVIATGIFIGALALLTPSERIYRLLRGQREGARRRR